MNLTATSSSSSATTVSSTGGSTVDDLIFSEESDQVAPPSPSFITTQNRTLFYDNKVESSFVNGANNSTGMEMVPDVLATSDGAVVLDSSDGANDDDTDTVTNNVHRISTKLLFPSSNNNNNHQQQHHNHRQMASKSNLMFSDTVVTQSTITSSLTSSLSTPPTSTSPFISATSAPSRNASLNKPNTINSWLLNPYSSNSNSKSSNLKKSNLTKLSKFESTSSTAGLNSLGSPQTAHFLNSNSNSPNHHNSHNSASSFHHHTAQHSGNNRLLLADTIDSGGHNNGVNSLDHNLNVMSDSTPESGSFLFISSHDIPILIGAAVGGIILLSIIIIVALVWYCCEWNISGPGDNYSIERHGSDCSAANNSSGASGASHCSSFDRISICPGVGPNGNGGGGGGATGCGCSGVRSSFSKLHHLHHGHSHHRHSASNCLYINNPNSVDSVDCFDSGGGAKHHNKFAPNNLGSGLDFGPITNNGQCTNQLNSTQTSSSIPRSISVPLSRSNSNCNKNDSSQNSTITSNDTTQTSVNSATTTTTVPSHQRQLQQYYCGSQGGMGRGSSLLSQAAVVRNISTYYENQKKKNGSTGVSCLLLEPSTIWSNKEVKTLGPKKTSILSNDLSLNMDMMNGLNDGLSKEDQKRALEEDDKQFLYDYDDDDRSTATWKINDHDDGDQMPLYWTNSLPWPQNGDKLSRDETAGSAAATMTADYQQVNQPDAIQQFNDRNLHCQTMGRINFTKKRRNRMRNDSAAAIALNRSGLGGSLDWDHPFVAPKSPKQTKNRSHHHHHHLPKPQQQQQQVSAAVAPSFVDNSIAISETVTAPAQSVDAILDETDSKCHNNNNNNSNHPTSANNNSEAIKTDNLVEDDIALGPSAGPDSDQSSPDQPLGPMVVYNERTAL